MKPWWALVAMGMVARTVVAMPVHPALDREPLLSVAQIESWLADSQQPITSVEDFLARLPQPYLNYYTLQYASRSLHDASPAHPRIILYGPDARLLIGISTTPQDQR